MQREGRTIRVRRARRGAIFVELAMVILVAYVFFAYVIGYARVFMGAQVVQNAADIAAREISRLPLPANVTFEDLLDNPTDPLYAEFREKIYREDKLVINLTGLRDGTFDTLEQLLDAMEIPIVNRALVPLMFEENVDFGGTTGVAPALRYPGTLAEAPGGGRTVIIPIVSTRSPSGAETIAEWARVIEEVESATSPDPFQLSSDEAGMVQLRVNYPYQSATMFSFQEDPVTGFSVRDPNYANDGAVTNAAAPPIPLVALAPTDGTHDPYGGQYGLGALEGLPFTTDEIFSGSEVAVRPWRRVISAQSFHRREVFE
jgi:hypothetical protein